MLTEEVAGQNCISGLCSHIWAATAISCGELNCTSVKWKLEQLDEVSFFFFFFFAYMLDTISFLLLHLIAMAIIWTLEACSHHLCAVLVSTVHARPVRGRFSSGTADTQ